MFLLNLYLVTLLLFVRVVEPIRTGTFEAYQKAMWRNSVLVLVGIDRTPRGKMGSSSHGILGWVPEIGWSKAQGQVYSECTQKVSYSMEEGVHGRGRTVLKFPLQLGLELPKW